MPAFHCDPGRLSARLLLQQPLDSDDGQGGTTTSWADVTQLWALIEPLSATPGEQAARQVAIHTHRVTLRHRTGLLRGMRFIFDGRFLLIRAISDPDASGRYLTCHCEEEEP
ncbi:phage head closure protein [Pseudohoeflea coraliihabitans]|uniref:Phage head closure protein n=1 Tax=Pseudohoeflea coraliihabitans TaxID=2860393 RepID=A0ABS6WRS0_9HYPH|nr:phage head closure protein [Pseudohoeflea sp. DP4N28-3]MBW3098662.1 phage head closure protein [Pseudohoeflea sp. DP4N28-3]